MTRSLGGQGGSCGSHKVRWPNTSCCGVETPARTQPGREGRPKLAFPVLSCGIAPDSFVIEITDFGLAPPVRLWSASSPIRHVVMVRGPGPTVSRPKSAIGRLPPMFFSSDFSSIFWVR